MKVSNNLTVLDICKIFVRWCNTYLGGLARKGGFAPLRLKKGAQVTWWGESW